MKNTSKQGPLSIAENIAWNSIGSLVYVVSNWIITVLAVILSEGYTVSGDLALCMAVGNLVATIVLFKTRTVQVADVDNEFLSGDYVAIKLISSGLAICFCLVYSFFTIPAPSMLPVFAYSLFKVFDSAVDVLHGIDQKHDRLDYVGISQIIRGILIVVAFCVGLGVYKSLTLAIFLMIGVTVAVVVIYDAPRAGQFESIRPRLKVHLQFRLFKTCFPGFLATLFCTFVVSIARQEYGMAYSSELLGIYAAVATPAVIVQALAGYIYSPLLGPIARAWAMRNRTPIVSLIKKFIAGLALIIIGSVAIFHVFGFYLLNMVYGFEVARYVTLMPLILLSTGVTAAMYFCIDLLVVMGGYRLSCIASLVSLISSFCITPWCVEQFDMNGVSLAITVSYLFGIAFALFVIRLFLLRRTNCD